MPDPRHNTAARLALPAGPFWTVEQAIDFYLHCNDGPRRMYEVASVFRPEDRAPDVFAALGTYRTPRQILTEENRAREVFEAFQTLRQIFATGDVPTGTDDGRVLNPDYWRVDPTRQVAEEFAAANGDFRTLLAQIALETAHVRVPVAKLVGFLSASVKPGPATADAPEPVASRPLTSTERKVEAALLKAYPEGQTAGWKEMMRKVGASRAVLGRVLPHMPADWRKRR